jgi:hypothetical protein
MKSCAQSNEKIWEIVIRPTSVANFRFGKSILAHKEDFSRHNPIDRWWGGTRLIDDRLWRWDPVLTAPAKG